MKKFKIFLLIPFLSAQNIGSPFPSTIASSSTTSEQTATSVADDLVSTSSIQAVHSSTTVGALSTNTSTTAQPTSSTSVVPPTISSTNVVPTTIFIVTVINDQSSTMSSISTPTSATSDPTALADSSPSSNLNSGALIYIFLAVIGTIVLAACGVYAFRCISLSPSEPFRKRLKNTMALDGMISESNSLHKTNSASKIVVYPATSGRYNSLGYKYPTSIRPIRYNVSNSTLGSLSSQPEAIIYPSLTQQQETENPEVQMNTYTAADQYYYQYDPSYVAVPASQVSTVDPYYNGHSEYYGHHHSVVYEDRRIEYIHAHPVPGPIYPTDAAVHNGSPVIVQVDGSQSNLSQVGSPTSLSNPTSLSRSL